jgi:hypothetical protein
VSGYVIAWVVITVAAVGGALAMHFWLRRHVSPLLHALALGIALGFFLLPAPVPGYDGHVAPAFVVAIFELLFQAEGQPAEALGILAIGCAVIVALVLAWHYLRRGARAGASREPNSD